jgi:hypothetical protein
MTNDELTAMAEVTEKLRRQEELTDGERKLKQKFIEEVNAERVHCETLTGNALCGSVSQRLAMSVEDITCLDCLRMMVSAHQFRIRRSKPTEES